MPYIDTPDYRIFFDVTGQGPAVLTLHGLIENGSYWGRTGVSGALAAAGYTAIDIDMRGHGRSVPLAADPDYSISALEADIDAVADRLGLGRFHLLTHATGGMVGARYAIRRSERLLSMIATDTASMTLPSDKYCAPEWDDRPIPPRPDLKGKPGAGLARLFREAGNFATLIEDSRRSDPDHFLCQYFRGFKVNPEPERCWRWVEEIYAVNNIALCGAFAQGFGFDDMDPQAAGLRQIACPVRLIVGELDGSLIRPMEVMARNIAHADHIVMKDAGHMIAIERPAETIRLVLDFLAG